MSFATLQAQREPVTRADKVIEAIETLREGAKVGARITGQDGIPHDVREEYLALKDVLQDEVAYGHQAVANALVNLHFIVDRRQVHNFREKLKLGKVTL